MQLNLLKISALFLFQAVALQSFSQIVINRQDFPAEDRLKQPVPRYAVYNSSFSALTEGSGQTWDLSNENINEKFEISYQENNNSDVFADASYRAIEMRTISDFPYRGAAYYEVNDNGSYELGRYQYDTSHSLALVTGNPDDQADIPEMAVPFSEPSTLLEFPAQMGDEIYSAADMKVYYNLTISAFGLNNTPFYTQQTRILEREIVGEGTLIIPSENGGDPLEVEALMVKLKNVYIDSTFSGDGNEAPPALLSAFGVAQGDTSYTEDGYFFVTKGFGFSVADIYLNNQGEIEEMYLTPTDYLESTGIGRRLTHTPHSTYPSMVKSGEQITIQANNEIIETVEFIGVNGQQQRLKPSHDGRFTIPASANPGIYIYRGLTAKGSVLRGKILVKP